MTLEEFKEYAKTVTRGEFLTNNAEKYYENFTPVILKNLENACPECVGLKNSDDGCLNCSKCWREAVKDIKFKDDIEKELIEAMNKQPIIVSDSVNHPSHYTHGKIETIDKIEDVLGLEGFQAYCVGNAIKYLDRYKLKNGFEDIKKAKRYLEFYIEKTEGKEC
ncbi:MAG: DUF3310 domain-containing protein [Clostridium paraputrificum]